MGIGPGGQHAPAKKAELTPCVFITPVRQYDDEIGPYTDWRVYVGDYHIATEAEESIALARATFVARNNGLPLIQASIK